MLQAGSVVNLHLPKDHISIAHQRCSFCEFLIENAEYACKIMNNGASSDKKQLDAGTNLFIGNLDENDAFGMMTMTSKIARDPVTGLSRGYSFVSYTDFESSDAATEFMNDQFLMNKAITVQYAFKKYAKGERHMVRLAGSFSSKFHRELNLFMLLG
ncbi:hypothetical protein BD769DRAFT_1626248 [Suillus cothurnatus]|nr:hypothetical protein BD769DRAFT_1626248 [Suillus cothurnatus]